MSDVLEPGKVFAGDWRVKKLLHRGAISQVYEAEQVSTGARRALKVVAAAVGIDPKFRELFLEEARRAASVRSEHVAEVMTSGIDKESDKPFVVLELLEGPSLASLVGDRGALPPGEVLGIMTQLGHALIAAHDVGLVHRDLKPEGIVLAESQLAGMPKRVEVQFVGAGKIASEALRNTTAAMGRPSWMAPEQSETDAKLTPATDVWTVGLLAFWMLTGRTYWKTGRDMGSAAMTLLREVLYEPLPPAGERAEEVGVAGLLPPGFDAWFARCVSREQEHRYQHAREAIGALTPILQAVAPLPAPTPPPPMAAVAPAHALPAPSGPPGGALYVASAPPRAVAAVPAKPTSASLKPAILVAVLLAVLGLFGGGGWFFYQSHLEKEKKAAQAKADKEREEEREAEREAEKKKREALKNWSDEESPVPVSGKDPMWGRREAPVTIVVFTDLECPFCSKLDATLDQLKIQHGPEKLRIIYKHAPLDFHKNAKRAHEIAEALFRAKGSEAFIKLKEKAFANRNQLGGDEPLEWAKELGLKTSDIEKNKEDLDRKIEADLEIWKKLGNKGVPTSFVNGIQLTGAQPIDKFNEVIGVELDKAKAELEKGTSPDKVYVARSKQNQEAPAPLPDPTPKPENDLWSVPIGDSPVLGPKTAKVTIVMFGDFQCPYCARVQTTLKDLRRDYGDRIRIVWKDNPLPMHKRAEPAAELAREVRAEKGDDGFWRLHDILFENQKALEDGDLKVYAFRAGANATKAMAAVKQQKHAKKIAEDQLLASGLEATGTPHFFINGRRLSGAQSLEKFKELIDREETLATAAMAAKSISAEAYYDELVQTGKKGGLEEKTPGPIPPGAPRKGAKNPKVVVQWFGDLECPFCAKSNTTVDEVLRDYGDRVQVVWRHLPLATIHPNARLAAMASEEVKSQLGDEAFFDFVTGAFDKKKVQALDRTTLEGVALDASRKAQKPFSVAGFQLALDANKHESRLKEDEEEAKRLGITGTPSFLVGKYLVRGAVDSAQMKSAIERALKSP
ncbi:MAG: thioredoxin domain-containing protein [Myxococcales bacterium]|nr:thioredoxin domain-containing protein [Myxococcales bacterium]